MTDKTPAQKIADTVNQWVEQGIHGDQLWFTPDGDGGSTIGHNHTYAPVAAIVVTIPDQPMTVEDAQDAIDHAPARRTAEDVDAETPADSYY